MSPRRLLPVASAATFLLLAGSVHAEVVPARLRLIASHSLLAAESPTGLRTAFSFGTAHTAIAGASKNDGIQLTTAAGASTVASASIREGDLVALSLADLGVSPLHTSGAHSISPGSLAYALGPPLGYESERIKAVRLPAFRLQSRRLISVSGSLPPSFQGGPVVTKTGRVIGAVAAVGSGRWTLAPKARLLTLLAATNQAHSGGGLPILIILAGVLVLIVLIAGFAADRARRKRRQAFEATGVIRQVPVAPPLEQHQTQPLVRLRNDPDPDPADDFDIVLKSREDS